MNGQLGHAELETAVPHQVVQFGDGLIIACGGHHSCAMKSDGTLWCWGANEHGQLGNDSTMDTSVPVQVMLPP